MTNIEFIASEVEYTEAIGGEIVQLSFDEDPDQDPFNRTKCYIMISQNYEFPGKPSMEWHDGKTDNGGAEIVSYTLTKSLFELTTKNNVSFKIEHNCSDEKLSLIKKFLYHEFGNGK